MPWWLIVLVIVIVLSVLGYGIYKLVSMDQKKPVKKKVKKCKVEGEDLFNKKLFDKSGILLTEQPKNLTCDTCGKYYYKEDGKCVQLEFGEDGVCVVGLGQSKPCPF